MNRKFLLCLLLLFTNLLTPAYSASTPQVFAGGYIGMQSLANPQSSNEFRRLGGGLYIHNSGWGTLSPSEKHQILTLFRNGPIGIEIGYGEGKEFGGWPALVNKEYVNSRVHESFFLVNCFDKNKYPTPASWGNFVHAIQVSSNSHSQIVPIIGYPNMNRGVNNDTAMENHMVSNFQPFQQLIKISGAIALDAPGNYFFGRNQVYKNWITDAVAWSRSQGFKVYLIISPHLSGKGFPSSSQQFLNYLSERGLMPDVIISENFLTPIPNNFINLVGSEQQPYSTLGVGLKLLQKYH